MAMRAESRGQSLVEFALVLPVFLLFVFVLIDGGRYVYTDSVLSQAAREAARVAAVEASWIGKTTSDDPGCNHPNGPVCRSSAALVAADAQAAANRMTIGLGGTITGISMSCDVAGAQPTSSPAWDAKTPPVSCTNATPGNVASVRLTFTYRSITPVLTEIIGPINRQGVATMVIN